MTWHDRSDGTVTRFEFRQESDGSRRLVDLLSAFLDLALQDTDRVYVIDEIDLSLQTLLTRRLVQAYHDQCTAKTRTQLLFNTHDVFLMDQHVLRRDKMWLAERERSGNSTLTVFSE
jgi:AAA15 family ATPase/GTPase